MKRNSFKFILVSIFLVSIAFLISLKFKGEYTQGLTNDEIPQNDNTNINNDITNDTDFNDNNTNANNNEDSNINNITNTNNSTNDNTNNDNSNNNEYNSNETIHNNISVKKQIKLIDKSNGYCAQAIEYFYEDRNYIYYFNCVKSSSMYVIINQKEYPLVMALENKIVTIEELKQNGYNFLKKSKLFEAK